MTEGAVSEAGVRPAGSPRHQRLTRASKPAAPAFFQRLSQAEVVAYYLVVAPLLSLLPARLAYRAARARGDWTHRLWADKRAEVTASLRRVLGPALTAAEAERLAREVFRIRSCEVIDLMLLRGRARGLRKLTEIRGREHLEAALAGGNGVLLCGAHFGSYLCAYSLLHASGFPVTTIGRWWWRYPPGERSATIRIWDFVYARRLLRHRQRPNIEPWPGRLQIAVQTAAALRAGDVVTICSDAPPLDAERGRAVDVPFLGSRASLLPGVVTLAKLTSAPVLMVSVHRGADYRHQVLEISRPVPMQGDPAAAFARCATALDRIIRAHPAEWDFWFEPGDLVRLGLVADPGLAAA